MRNKKIGQVCVWVICILLTVGAFFAKDFVLYDFHMLVSDYTYGESAEEKPAYADTAFWFSYGDDRAVQYGFDEGISYDDIALYAKTETEVLRVSDEDEYPFSEDFIGYLIAVVPPQTQIINGEEKTVYDFARADFGPHTFELTPRAFNSEEIAFELAFEERNRIQVFYKNEYLTNARITVIGSDGSEHTYTTDSDGYIEDFPIKYIRNGFTASYEPDGTSVYRMSYALEDYSYFTTHFYKAHLPVLVVLLITAVCIGCVCLIRKQYEKKKSTHKCAGKHSVKFRNDLRGTASSKFLLIRWLFLIFGFFWWTYAGKLISGGQALNQIAVPVFSCPFNLDQVLESSCYYLTHLPVLFTRNIFYVISFLVTLFLFLIFGGRILCGFMCPLGFIQDLMDKLRSALHIKPIYVSERMNKALQPLKWIWIIMFFCLVFAGVDFCDICPNKVFSSAFGGFWVNLALCGFLTIAILVCSFFIRRFWCIICPMGYLLGIFYKFNLFKLKKDCTACTECGACYESCPMRLKNIYTEREKENVQTVDCLMCGECINKCPEDHALRMTFCGKTIYQSSRMGFMSKFASKKRRKKERERDV
ncbi:MAG: 4Fe-4S binding protein [Firmicutes bacterium]|nr:4Fe-4S binding protein [Bacillota bacterium]